MDSAAAGACTGAEPSRRATALLEPFTDVLLNPLHAVAGQLQVFDFLAVAGPAVRLHAVAEPLAGDAVLLAAQVHVLGLDAVSGDEVGRLGLDDSEHAVDVLPEAAREGRPALAVVRVLAVVAVLVDALGEAVGAGV